MKKGLTELVFILDKRGIWRQRFVGYSCSHRLSLEFALDVKRLAAVLGAIAECEAQPQFKISFTVKDPTAVSEQLLENAVTDATLKAKTLAKAASVKLRAIQRIDYNWGEIRLFSDTDMDIKACAAMPPTSASFDIEPDDIDVSDSVSVVWAIE
jgi:uncharacterized protein YggE